MNTRGALTALVLGAFLLAGCGNDGADDRKDAPLPTASEELIAAQAQRYVGQVVTAVGTAPLQNADALLGACEGRGGEVSGEDKFTANAGGQIPLPEARHRATLTRIHDQWKQSGWSVTEYRFFPGGTTGIVAARTPDGFAVSLSSAEPPSALALSVHSRCYQKAATG